MFKVVVLVSVIACAFCAAVPVGMLPQLDGRIVGGKEISISEAPYQISLQRYGSHACGGIVYSSNYVITAAHCVFTVNSPSLLKVRAGSSEWHTGGVLVNVESLKYHEGFNIYDMDNDIALLKLSSPLPNLATIVPIPLATSSPAGGAAALVSGWGTTNSGGSNLPSVLRGVDVNIVTKNDCASSSYGYGSKVGETMICAYALGRDACQGDSGGPLVSGGVLVGVVSWGYGCAYPNYPGVYASVATLHKWVTDTAASL